MEKKKEKCSLFEEMLMWTSYRYCIGRHTYVTTMARDIAQNYYDRLSDERLEFTAKDIRKEISDHLKFFPFNLHTEGIYGDYPDFLDLLLKFFEQEKISSVDDLVKYNSIAYVYNHSDKTYKYIATKDTPTIKRYFNIGDIDDLIMWMNLANCFDKKNYVTITEPDGRKVECFKTWVRKVVPDETGKYFRSADFGWEEAYVSVDSYLKEGNLSYIIKSELEKIKNKVK